MASDALSTSPILQAAHALRPKVEAAAAQIDDQSRIPPELVSALMEAGLFRLYVPRAYGGAEVTLLEFAQIIEEIGSADASTAWCLAQNAGVCRMAGFLPADAAAEIFGRTDLALAWGQGRARAVKVEGGYRLTGEWAFVSGIRHATWLGCQSVPVTDEIGEPIRDHDGEPERRIFVFPADVAEIDEVWNVSGLRGTGSDTFRVADLFVPAHHSPGLEPVRPGPLYVFNTTNIFSAGFAAAALGVARGALDAFEDLSITKAPRGVNGVLREQQTVQVHIGIGEATVRSARAYLHEVVQKAWDEVLVTREMTLDTRIQLRLASTFAIKKSADVVEQVYKLAGTSAIARGGPIERRLRDIHAITQHIQGREDHFEGPGQYFLGLEPDKQWL
jgi:alkylation response protein AidB-like acyl-CoA dehydrogenase